MTLVGVARRPIALTHRSTGESDDPKSKIAELAIAPAGANLFAAIDAVFRDDSASFVEPVVYFITDSQASSFRELEQQPSAAERALPSGTKFVVVNVGTRTARGNLAVIGDAPSRQRLVVGFPTILSARVQNASDDAAEASLTFFVNDKVVERQEFRLNPNETAIRTLSPYIPINPGPKQCRFEVAGRTLDSFPDDDRFLFVLQVEPQIKVLIVNGAPSADSFENETLYLRAALAGDRPIRGDGVEQHRMLDVIEEEESAWANLDEQQLGAKLGAVRKLTLHFCFGFGVLACHGPDTQGSGYPPALCNGGFDA